MSSSTYRCVVVDDEAASREVLSVYLERYCPQLELAGTAADVEQGLALIDRVRPQVVFLDIEMPFKSGFELLSAYRTRDFEVIFVTAYSDQAINAIHVSAADYLLKPVSIEQLQAAVAKAVKRIGEQHLVDHARVLLDNLRSPDPAAQQVVLPLLDGFEVVASKDIVRCEAEDNFTLFHLADGTRRLICRPLKHYENALVPLGFVRVHRSHMVQRTAIKRYVKGKGGTLFLLDGSEVPVSETHKSALLELFRG
jgi:two-component system, LytTR family, response regulator